MPLLSATFSVSDTSDYFSFLGKINRRLSFRRGKHFEKFKGTPKTTRTTLLFCASAQRNELKMFDEILHFITHLDTDPQAIKFYA